MPKKHLQIANIVDGSPTCSKYELKTNENTSTQLFYCLYLNKEKSS